MIELENGTTFAFPPALIERLADATPEQIGEIEVISDGYGLHWPAVDEDLTVPGLLSGIFGRPKWMASLVERGLLPAFKRAA